MTQQTGCGIKKILIVYATAGAGHKKAAQALERRARGYSGCEVISADIVDFMPRWIKALYSDGYTLLISRFPWLWAVLYRLSDSPLLSLVNVHLRRFSDARMCGRFLRFLQQEQPDAVLSTQFLASEMAAYAKAKSLLKTKLVTVVTDYGVHNFWVNPLTDLYCCAAESTRRLLLNKGVPEKNIRVTGIPLDEKFLRGRQRSEIHESLGTRAGRFTVLIATGGIGIGPIETLVDTLGDHAQLLVVCGHNKALLEALQKKRQETLRAFGFVDNMDELMRASDLMVTKAGGLSVTEALSMGLPMIFFCLLPGQEMINARMISSLKAGLIASDIDAIRQAVLDFKEHPGMAESYRKNALRLARPQSSADIISATLS
ncbi:MAG: glycosyltransferase [Candidatus Omnitrophota bacterium]